MTLVNDWSADPNRPPEFFKDSFGMVHFRGVAERSQGFCNAAAFNLPPGYRPPYQMDFLTAQAGVEISGFDWQVRIHADGTVDVCTRGSLHLNGIVPYMASN